MNRADCVARHHHQRSGCEAARNLWRLQMAQLAFIYKLNVADAKERTSGFVLETFNVPAVGQDNLLNYSQAKAGALFVSGEIRFKNFHPVFRRNTRAIVRNLKKDVGMIATA